MRRMPSRKSPMPPRKFRAPAIVTIYLCSVIAARLQRSDTRSESYGSGTCGVGPCGSGPCGSGPCPRTISALSRSRPRPASVPAKASRAGPLCPRVRSHRQPAAAALTSRSGGCGAHSRPHRCPQASRRTERRAALRRREAPAPFSGIRDPHRESQETAAPGEARVPRMGAGQPQKGAGASRRRLALHPTLFISHNSRASPLPHESLAPQYVHSHR